MTETNMGKIISDNRKRLGLTQERLAERLNVSNKTISKWENGKGVPDTLIIPVLARELGISINALFGKVDNVNNHEDAKMRRDTERVMAHNRKILISILMVVLSPLVIGLAWLLQSYVGVVVAAILVATSMIASIVMVAVGFSAARQISLRGAAEKYAIRSVKNSVSSYSFIWYVIFGFLTFIVCGNPDRLSVLELPSIFIVHFGFLFSLLYIAFSLRLEMKSRKNLILLIISSLFLAIGLFFVIALKSIGESYLLYLPCFFLSQIINYITVFSTGKIREEKG